MKSNEKTKSTKENNPPTEGSSSNGEFPRGSNIFETTYEKVLSIINQVKEFIKKNSKKSQKLIEDLEWVIKVITNKSLYTYKVNKTKLTKRNSEINRFINFVTQYNEEILEINKKHILVSSIFNISKKGEILNKPSLCLKKILPDELKNLDYQKEKEKNERRKNSINQIGNVILKLYYKGLEKQKKEKEEKEKAEKGQMEKIEVMIGKKEEKENKTAKKEEKKDIKKEIKTEKKEDKKEKTIKIEKIDLSKKFKKIDKKEMKPKTHILHNSNSQLVGINNTSQTKKMNKMNTSKYNNLKRISMDNYMYKKSAEIRKKIKNKEKDNEFSVNNSPQKDKNNNNNNSQILNKNLSLTSIKKAMENYYNTHINLLEAKNKRKNKSIYLDKEINTDQSPIKINISSKLHLFKEQSSIEKNLKNQKNYIQIKNKSKSNNKSVKKEERIPINSLIDKYFNELRNIEDKDFNIFEFKKKVGYKNVLPLICHTILKTLGLLDSRIISLNKLGSFLYTVSDGYKESTLYHNALHGADVTQSLCSFLIQTNAEAISESTVLDVLGLAISAMGHDLGHPGYNNNFHVNASTDLALTYNDSSCLENFHTSFLFKILHKDENNIFEKLGTQNYKSIRKRMISQILSTDMANHGEVVSLIRAKIKSSEEELGPGNFNLLSGNEKSKFNEQQMLYNYLIHAADLGHNCKKFEICIQWVKVLCEEFWMQGDMEKSKGIPVSFLCDRDKIDVPASQIGFLRGFILTTFDCLVSMFPVTKYTIENTENNIKRWQELSAQKRVTGWTPEKKVKEDKDEKKKN